MSENTVTHLPLKSTTKEPVSGAPAQAANYDSIPLAKMQPGERIAAFVAKTGRYSLHRASDTLYRFDGAIWRAISDSAVKSDLADFYMTRGFQPGASVFESDARALKIYSSTKQSPEMAEPKAGVIAFANGVYSIIDGSFSSHCAENWLRSHNGIDYAAALPGETLSGSAPHFSKWLAHNAGNDEAKAKRILAALYMVLTHRYEWQLYVEVTGKGGSGKSVFMSLCRLLSGEDGSKATTLHALRDSMALETLIDARLITMSDQPAYSGDCANLKAITGGDSIFINPKYKKGFDAKINAVVVVANNEPAVFTEHNGGISRRRVLFKFGEPVERPDPEFMAKIKTELPVIVRHLLKELDDTTAKSLLIQQRDSEESFDAKAEASSIYSFVKHLDPLPAPTGMRMGGKPATTNEERPREYLYHAYLAFMQYNGYTNPLSVLKFKQAVTALMKERGFPFEEKKNSVGVRYNITLADTADEWLPQASTNN